MRTTLSTFLESLIITLGIYLAANSQGLDVIGSCPTPDKAWAIHVDGTYAYVACDSSGLEVIDVTDPTTPTIVASYDTPGRAIDLFVAGQYAYIADYSSLQIINISNPLSPAYAGSHPAYGTIGVHVDGDYAYLASGYHPPVIEILNISNPASPESTSSLTFLGGAFDLYCSSGYLCALSNETEPYANYLRIVDVSDPHNPIVSGSIRIPGDVEIPWDVKVIEDYAYVADGAEGLQIVNITDPVHPVVVGSYDTPGNATGVFVSDDYAFIADHSNGVQLVNVLDPTNPTFLSECDTDGQALGIYATGGYAYVADWYSLVILRYNPTGVGEEKRWLGEFSLSHNYPNPFNIRTIIRYALPKASNVSIEVYSLLGHKVAILVNGPVQAGPQTVTWDASDFPSGLYFYRLRSGSKVLTGRMSMVK